MHLRGAYTFASDALISNPSDVKRGAMILSGAPRLLGWSLGAWEIAVLLVLALLLLGPKRLPEVAKSMAQAIRGFKHELHATREELEDALEDSASIKPTDKGDKLKK